MLVYPKILRTYLMNDSKGNPIIITYFYNFVLVSLVNRVAFLLPEGFFLK